MARPPQADRAEPPLPFEQALERLEQVVDRLEEGELELEASLEVFEEGVRLTQACAKQLEVAEERVEILMREGGHWLARPFATDGPDGGPADEEEDLG